MRDVIHTQDSVPRTLKRILYSLYSILTLCVGMFFFIIPGVFIYFHLGKVTEEKRRKLHYFIYKASNFIVRRIPGTSLTAKNDAGEDFEKPGVIICNHQSHLDLMCILMLTSKLVVLTNDWVHNNPIYGLLIRYAEFHSVSDGMNMDVMADLVRRGYSVVIFPEGTRSEDCSILRFHRGAFYLAETLELDIIPVFIHGVGDVLPKKDFMLREGHLYVEVGNRISRDGMDYREWCSVIRKYYQNHYSLIRRQRENADYYSWYTCSKFGFCGINAKCECRRALSDNDNYRDIIDKEYSCEAIIIRNDRIGAFTLNYSLVHKDIKVYAINPNHVLYQIKSLPENLCLCAREEECPESACKTITL